MRYVGLLFLCLIFLCSPATAQNRISYGYPNVQKRDMPKAIATGTLSFERCIQDPGNPVYCYKFKAKKRKNAWNNKCLMIASMFDPLLQPPSLKRQKFSIHKIDPDTAKSDRVRSVFKNMGKTLDHVMLGDTRFSRGKDELSIIPIEVMPCVKSKAQDPDDVWQKLPIENFKFPETAEIVPDCLLAEYWTLSRFLSHGYRDYYCVLMPSQGGFDVGKDLMNNYMTATGPAGFKPFGDHKSRGDKAGLYMRNIPDPFKEDDHCNEIFAISAVHARNIDLFYNLLAVKRDLPKGYDVIGIGIQRRGGCWTE